ncbi:MAG: heavy-metal-associated domain-containing protein [Proteobacteria bacterium]|nr:heavy-metal-associated domain-containing protein [Pseudomonadota bacterium]
MLEFTLPDMSCGHCASKVAIACRLVDPRAQVDIDVGKRQLKIESPESRDDFSDALAEAGYPPTP